VLPKKRIHDFQSKVVTLTPYGVKIDNAQTIQSKKGNFIS
jgi:hypothetical protein